MRTPGPDDKRESHSRSLILLFPTIPACIRPPLRLLSWMPFRRFSLLFCLAVLSLALPALPASAGQISPLAPKPDWSMLNAYQKTITKREFTRLINEIYTPDKAFWTYAKIDDDKVTLYSDLAKTEPLFTLQFAPDVDNQSPLPAVYKTKAISTDPEKPLKGLKIALDPGHIGGDWAQLEARYFKIGKDPSVEEAKLNLITCEILAEKLKADGAEIIWAKRGYEPVTHLRPDDLHNEAIAALSLAQTNGSQTDPPSFVFGLKLPHVSKRNSTKATQSRIDYEAALLFYRVAEIRARAELVNKQKPDLTICVHYNADDWGDPDKPTLTNSSRLIIFVNGCYEKKAELTYDDYKYDLMRKLLDRTAVQEMKGCALVGQEMLDTLKYPAEVYPDMPGVILKDSPSIHHVTDVPSVYARDLMANRLYHGPVIYCEGPYMNARDAYYRIIAGDYLGTKNIHGEEVPSIYRQYATAVEQGVLKYFGTK